ncbi:DUF1508 domain-containing protein [Cytophagaceae bacterium SJW1-29]|uniref:DUF1508 domain-containing protein n=2 Tax=Salmonirosea aquatica TaxID=2654236 RepID=A0A7C9FZH3_9BACT|nr:DUF1508 domain-containing protein [Cytophagaceae bacterium SJW1-29]
MFKLVKTRSGQFRWKRIAPNSRTVGGATEPYHNRTDCLDNARRNGVPPYMIEE